MIYVCAGNISINRRHPLRTRLAFWQLGMQEPIYLPAPTRWELHPPGGHAFAQTPDTWPRVPEGGPRRPWGAQRDTKQLQRTTSRNPPTWHLDLHGPADPHDAPPTGPCKGNGQWGEKPERAQVMVLCDPSGNCHQRRGCHEKNQKWGAGSHFSITLKNWTWLQEWVQCYFPLLFPLISSNHFSLHPSLFFFLLRESVVFTYLPSKLFPSYRSWHDS